MPVVIEGPSEPLDGAGVIDLPARIGLIRLLSNRLDYTLEEDQVVFGTPEPLDPSELPDQVYSITPNTKINADVDAPGLGQLQFTLYYHRLDLTQLLAEQNLEFSDDTSLYNSARDFANPIGSRFNVGFVAGDFVESPMPSTRSDGDYPQPYTIQADPASLGYIGQVDITLTVPWYYDGTIGGGGDGDGDGGDKGPLPPPPGGQFES